jgi:prevent-host-death family protein
MTVTATESKQKFGAMLDHVGQGPVFIEKHGREAAVMVSPETFAEYRKLKAKALMDVCREISAYAKARGMTEKKLQKLLAERDGD